MTSPEIHFVISSPRSGSTWLAQALNQHAEIFATEQRLFGNFCEMWPNNNGKLAPRITLDAYARALSVHYFHDELKLSRTEFIDSYIREYSQFLLGFAKKTTGKSIVIDKVTPYPGTTKLVIEQIKKYFPNSKIVKLVRDGRDVVTSGTFDWLLKDGQGTNRYKCFVAQDSSVLVRRFFDDEAIKKWAEIWRESVRDVPSCDLEISYEEMSAGLSETLSRIFELVGVSSSAAISQKCASEVTFEKLTGRSNGQMDPTAKQRSGTAGDWKNYFTRSDGRLFDSIAGQDLRAKGYVNSETWFETLPEELAIRYAAPVEGAAKP